MRPERTDWHWRARRVLARFGPRTVPALVEALSTGDDPVIREFAAESLGQFGHEARSASAALQHAARHDESPAVRAAAASALEALEESGRAT
jgi:HEAT repeat protein